MNKQHWQRVSPWALVYFVLHFAYRFVKDGIFNLLPIAVVFVTQVQNKLFWGQIAAAVAVVALLVYSIAYYINFRFCITDDHDIMLNKGVFKKERLTLSFLRVQNVNIAEPFYFKPLGLVNCIFDAAGSVSQEVVLPGVTTHYAESMREQVLTYKEVEDKELTSSSSQYVQNDPLLSLMLSNKEVAKFGLMSNMAILALAALAPFMNVIFDYLEDAVIKRLEVFYEQEVGTLVNAAALAVFSILFLVILVAVLLSVIMSLIRFYNYELYFKEGKFKRIAGLLERHQLSVSLEKVQSIVIKQNLIARLLNRYTIQCFQATSGLAAGAKSKQSLVMPVLNIAQVNQTLLWVYPWLNRDNFDFKALNFKGVEKALLYKNTVFYALLPSLIIGVGGYISDVLHPLHGVVGFCFLSVFVYLSYVRYGYYFYQHNGRYYGIFRSGMLGVQYRVFELYKAQSARSISTFLMRNSDLKSLSIQLASGSVSLPYLKSHIANDIIDFTLLQAESEQRRWM
ncbi:PH domain-containing protein [Pseudoalteromonas sp. H105]|uniref:PH domain-containing protein n=1 Tax=Pseudoalteromonas sp. H105 TaxID=1348393 RepID=UPI0007321879|nr:PH domain-containing protein [Pseudoalteromonas sp. H105]KTF13682.1 stress protein [Pseudoalteromonas sp. H105]